jgi:hypothetical protein
VVIILEVAAVERLKRDREHLERLALFVLLVVFRYPARFFGRWR